jgi:hypothetical protein
VGFQDDQSGNNLVADKHDDDAAKEKWEADTRREAKHKNSSISSRCVAAVRYNSGRRVIPVVSMITQLLQPPEQ